MLTVLHYGGPTRMQTLSSRRRCRSWTSDRVAKEDADRVANEAGL